MSAAWGHAIGVLILVMLLVFIAVWLWAWSPHHKTDFDELARMPMRDDEGSIP
jgi:cytochrome c oxidase cbb3-type subunit IV